MSVSRASKNLFDHIVLTPIRYFTMCGANEQTKWNAVRAVAYSLSPLLLRCKLCDVG